MDEKKPNPGADDVMTGISHPYPSPSVETTDAQFYHISAQRDGEIEHQAAQSDGTNQPDGLPTVTDHQAQHDHHENHDLHELQELQDPVSPSQHARPGPSLSNEDLQLAAQLTQDLAPVIAAAAASHNQAQEEQLQVPVQVEVPVQTEDVDMQNDAGDPDLQEQLQVQLQNHDHELQSVMQSHAEQQQQQQQQQQEQQQQDQNRQQQDQQQQQQSPQQQPSQTLQQQPLQQQQQSQVPVQAHPHYVQQMSQTQHTPGPTPTHLSTQIPIDHLAGAHPQYGAAVQDNTPPRKRSKVSRACDECRRKKIKCDAQSEVSDQPCSNCRRSSAPCLFSRVPQKRGPSKGYIKELADRINTIEGKLTGAAVPDPLDRRRTTPAEAFVGSPIAGAGDDGIGRKRPYSSISSDNFTPPTTAHERLAGWGSEANRAPEHRPIRPYHPTTYPQIHSVNDLVPKPLAMSQSPDVNGVQAQASAEAAAADVASQDGLASNGMSQEPLEQAREISDVAFECYLNSVHRIFPILASRRDRVHSMLSQCPPVLQEAFYHALFAMLNPMLPESAGRENCNSLTSHGLLNEWDSQPRTVSSPVADLVCLQTLIMLIIEADYSGISAVKGQRGGPKKLSLLGEAVGLGYIMKLHVAPPPDINPNMDLDPDSEKNIALRAWWTLVALDRWNAVGTAAPSMISSDVVVTPGLRNVMGDVVYNYTKISFLLTQFIPLFLTLSAPTPSDFAVLTTRKPMVASLLNALIESFRWQFPAELITSPSSDPMSLLAYWHVRLLADLCSGGAKADFALQDCANIVGILTGNPELLTPLNHHFVSLVSLALLELEKLERTKDDAGRLLKDLLDFRVAASPWTSVVRDKIMNVSLVNRERNSQAVVNGSHNNNNAAAAVSSQSHVQSQLQAALQSQSLSQPLQQLADLATVAAGVEQNANDANAESMVSSAAAVAAAAAAVAAAAAAHHQQQNAGLSSVSPSSQVIPTSLEPEGNTGQTRGETTADRDANMDLGGASTESNQERQGNGAEHAEPEPEPEQQQHFKTEYRSDEEHEFKTEPQPETRPEDHHQSRQQQPSEQQEPQQQQQQHVLSASPVDESGIAACTGQTDATTSAQEPEPQQPAQEAPAREATSAALVVETPNGTSTADQNGNKEDITSNGTSAGHSQASLTASLALSIGAGFGALGLNTAEIYEHYQRQQQELQLQKQAQQATQQSQQSQSQSQVQPQAQAQQSPSQDQQPQQQQPYHQQRFEPKESQPQPQPVQISQPAPQQQQQSSIPLSQAQIQAQQQLQQVVAKQQQLVLQTLQQHRQSQAQTAARPYEPEVFLKAGYLTCFGDEHPLAVPDAGNVGNGTGSASGAAATVVGSGIGIGSGSGSVNANGNGVTSSGSAVATNGNANVNANGTGSAGNGTSK